MEPERRITDRLIQYWQQIKGDDVLPSAGRVDSDEMGDMWEDCFVIEIRPNPALAGDFAYSYSYVGRDIHEFLTPENGEVERENLLTVPFDKLSAFYEEMLMTKLPIVEEVEDQPYEGGVMKYRQCLCPLGTPDGQIRGIIGGMRYKIF